jgi:hypothetical protein
MLTARVALIDQTNQIPFQRICAVASALNLQVQRDLSPIWKLSAVVFGLPSAASIPLGTWPIFIVDRLPLGEGGAHVTRGNQPYAKVARGDGWTLAASHECLGMLVDPSGNRLYASNAMGVFDGRPRETVGKCEYLVQVCDPSGDAPFSYSIDDVVVSDFYTPHYFDPVAVSGVRYSFTGALKRPREVLRNGYLSWLNAETGTLQQLRHHNVPQVIDLGRPAGSSLRAFVDNRSRPSVSLSELCNDTTRILSAAQARSECLQAAASAKADSYLP